MNCCASSILNWFIPDRVGCVSQERHIAALFQGLHFPLHLTVWQSLHSPYNTPLTMDIITFPNSPCRLHQPFEPAGDQQELLRVNCKSN